MLPKIVGSEEYVKTIRMMNTVRDDLTSGKRQASITSGSFGEGLEMRGGDLDIMIVWKEIEVCDDTNILLNPNKSYFAMETDLTQPGFTQLRLLHSFHDNIFQLCDERGGNFYFSNTAFKQMVSTKNFSIVHGPCLSDKEGIFDLAVCCQSKSWIAPAKQWITRSSNSWPGIDVKKSIIQHGVLFVPIGVKYSTNEDLEWRLSFSIGEKYLVYTFTHSQLLCYALMKILLKDVISIDLECSDLLCSYFMKTILFWISEEFSPEIWKPENLISNFMKCFRRLIYCAENSVCPHYFIPENNLFENKIRGQAQKKLLKKLYFLKSYDWQCILLSDQFSTFHEEFFHRLKEPNSLYFDGIDKLLFSMINVADFSTGQSSLDRKIRKALSSQSSRIRYIYWYYISKFCNTRIQFCPSNESSGHKASYRHYKICISTLLLNLNHDAVSGWLLIATLFYQTKQYNSAIYILQYSSSKCTPEKMQHLRYLSNINYELLILNSFRKMNIVQLWKLLRIDSVLFSENSTILPDDLKLKLGSEPCSIPPLVYAHFLRFLCNFYLNNVRKCRDSLEDLKLTTDGEYFIANPEDKAFAYCILGIAFEISGDFESAKQAFIQSWRL